MSKTIVFAGSAVVAVMITAVTLLLVLEKDPSTLIAFMTAAIIPTVISFLGLQKAGKAADAAEKTVENTNGRMTELIANNRVLSEQLAAVNATPPPTPMTTKTQYTTDADGNPVLRRTR